MVIKIKVKGKKTNEAAKKKKKESYLTHAFVYLTSETLCGKARNEPATAKVSDVSCPECQVLIDEGLEKGQYQVNKEGFLVLSSNYIENLYVVYTENVERENDDDRNYNSKFSYVTAKRPANPNYSLVDVNFPVDVGDKVFISWVTFSEGSTLGMNRGIFEAVGAFKTKEEAEASLQGKEEEYGGDYFGGELESANVEEVTVK